MNIFSRKKEPIVAEVAQPTFSANEVETIVQGIMRTLDVNSSDLDSIVRTRMQSMVSGGYDFTDTLHNVYTDYGYPASLQFNNYWNMYRRFGIARNVIHLPTDTCWITNPMVKGSASFDREFKDLLDQTRLWQRVKGLDTRQRVGRYAGMFVRVRDNKKPEEELVKGSLNGPGSVVNLMPLYESQLEVLTTEDDIMSDRYGQPVTYQYNGSVTGDRNEKSSMSTTIHYTRIVPAAEGADDGWIYGIPALEAPYNSLMDLRKIVGAGGEGFYRNASHRTVFSLKDTANANISAEVLQKFNDSIDDNIKNGMRRALLAPGMDVKPLQSSLISNKDFFDSALNDVAAACQIPATILIGKQTGRLASGEDSRHFLATMQQRREIYLLELIESILGWFVEYGILPDDSMEIEWDDLLARSDEEKFANSSKLADINKKQADSGGVRPFSEEEIRNAAGFDSNVPEDDGEEDEGENELDELDDGVESEEPEEEDSDEPQD